MEILLQLVLRGEKPLPTFTNNTEKALILFLKIIIIFKFCLFGSLLLIIIDKFDTEF